MKTIRILLVTALIFLSTTILAVEPLNSPTDPLPSWNAGPTKQRILDFVKKVTNKKSSQYVPPAERIATIDNDGTLWIEQPIYTQVLFAIDRLKALAPQHPQWQNQQPFKTVLSGDSQALASLSMQDLAKILAVTHSGMSVTDFQALEVKWLAEAINPHFNRPYTQLVYQPMLELMDLLRQHEFKIYIVTGGGQEFVRTFADKVYGVPLEQVIGTAGKTKYVYNNGQPELIKLSSVELVDDHAGKPEAINLFIGRQPILAVGNSDGDRQMLEWTQARPGAHLMLLVHHDDAQREFAYDTESKVGTFSNALMQEAKAQGWSVISMKQDWRVIFPPVDVKS